MAELSQALATLGDHERRITVTEEQVKQMATRLHVTEIVGELREDVSSLRTAVETSARATEKSVAKLAEDGANMWTRLSALNEENMQRAATSEKEKHDSEMALLEEQLKQVKLANEDSKFINRVKNHWMPILGLTIAGSAVLGIAGGFATWIIKLLLKI